MNQIIFSEHENVKDIKKSRGKFFKFLLYMSIVLIFCVTFYFLYSSYILNEKERISKNLLNTFNLEHLYSSNSNYTVITLNNNSNEKYFVIGTIEISSISSGNSKAFGKSLWKQILPSIVFEDVICSLFTS